MDLDSSALLFGLIFAAVICGWIGWFLADKKGLGVAGWWLGFLLGPIGILIVAIMQPKEKVTRPQRKCPFCAEIILAEAVVCRYCQRDLPQVAPYKPDPIFRSAAK